VLSFLFLRIWRRICGLVSASSLVASLDGIRAFAAAITAPSEELCTAVDLFDPASEATVLTNWLIPTGEVCGRPVHGPVRSERKALEDKLIIDELWDRAGVERAPSVIVDPTEETAVHEALVGLANADGAVLVADNTEGWHGGGEYARYLAPGADQSDTLRFFAEHSRRVRIMPFLKGVPCSIHGLVTSDAALAFRPVEMLVYRRAGSDEFVYAGMNTVWHPPAQVRDQMRRAVQSVGALIREEAGYRGAFGIDGVCTGQGFLPTELNPRLTPGLGMQAEAAGRYPIGDINRAVIAGLDADLRLDKLERRATAWSLYRRGRRSLIRPVGQDVGHPYRRPRPRDSIPGVTASAAGAGPVRIRATGKLDSTRRASDFADCGKTNRHVLASNPWRDPHRLADACRRIPADSPAPLPISSRHILPNRGGGVVRRLLGVAGSQTQRWMGGSNARHGHLGTVQCFRAMCSLLG